MRRLVLIVFALAACAGAGTAKPPAPANTTFAKPKLPRSTLTIDELTRSDSTMTFRYDDDEYASAEAALAAMRRTEDSELSAIQPANIPVGGTLRIIISMRPAEWTSRNATGMVSLGPPALSQSVAVTVEHQIAAIRQSHLFSSVTVEHGAAPFVDWPDGPLPDPAPADLVLWHDSRAWHLRGDQRNPITLSNRFASLAAWLTGVRVSATEAKTQSRDDVQFGSVDGWRTITVRYRGVRYDGTEALAKALDAAYAQEIATLAPLHDRLAGKALIVVATLSQAKPQMAPAGASSEANDTIAKMVQVSYAATAKYRVEALRRSHLFDTVTVETEDVSDMPFAGYDDILFAMADRPLLWKYKVAEGEAQILTLPKGDLSTTQMVEAIREQLREARLKAAGK
jgi:hypothetical protein